MAQSKNNNLPDQILLERAIQGSTEAFGDLYEFFLEEIQGYVFYHIGNRLEAEDLTEIVFIKAWEALSRFENAKVNLRAWLYRIARNTIIDYFRTRKPTTDIPAEDLRDSLPSPERLLQTHDEKEQLIAAIQELDDKLKNVIICRFINNLSHAETAQILGIREGYVRVLQHRALLKLRELLEENR